LRFATVIGGGLAFLLAGSAFWAQAQEPRAADLARCLGCFACHGQPGTGSNRAAPLQGVGSRLTPRELRTALAFPRQLHPGAKMPSYAYLPPVEQEALVVFLETFK
jgi:hypothetical protein